MRLAEKIDSREILATLWGLFGAYTGIVFGNQNGLDGAVAVFSTTMFFLVSYIVADEFIERSRC
ncbi:MAG: hypothetical protein ABEJ64_01725 [Candidatus Nanohaloarchaea archaeon]